MKKIICIIFIFLILLSILGILGLFFKNKVDQNDLERVSVADLIKAHEIIMNQWTYATEEYKWISGEINCEDLGNPQNTHPLFLRCNIDYLNCLYRNKKVYKDIELRPITPDSHYSRMFKTGENLPRNLNYAIHAILSDKKTGKILNIFLNPTCHQVTLPERVYGYGEFDPQNIDHDFRFDTFNRKIAVDKFPVSVSEVNILRKIQGKDLIAGIPAAPATTLNFKEQEEYCHFRGKRIMEAMYFDAMSFHPIDRDNPRVPILRRSPYPWSRIKSDSFLTNTNNDELTDHNCELSFIKDCVDKYPRKYYSPASASWVGASMLLGYDMEALKNPYEPRHNLKVSSEFFPRKSSWHRLGKRGYWDGKDFNYKNINFKFEEPENADKETYPIAFRCMREL